MRDLMLDAGAWIPLCTIIAAWLEWRRKTDAVPPGLAPELIHNVKRRRVIFTLVAAGMGATVGGAIAFAIVVLGYWLGWT